MVRRWVCCFFFVCLSLSHRVLRCICECNCTCLGNHAELDARTRKRKNWSKFSNSFDFAKERIPFGRDRCVCAAPYSLIWLDAHILCRLDAMRFNSIIYRWLSFGYESTCARRSGFAWARSRRTAHTLPTEQFKANRFLFDKYCKWIQFAHTAHTHTKHQRRIGGRMEFPLCT